MAERGYKPPNYTQVPNRLLEDELPNIDSLAELKVLLAVARATVGWHVREHTLSISDLEQRTGMSRQSVVDGVKKALASDRLLRRQDGQRYLYSLAIQSSPESGHPPVASPESGPVAAPTSEESGPVASEESRPPSTKESVERNGNEKKEREAAPPAAATQGSLLPDERHPQLDAVRTRLYKVANLHHAKPPSDQAILGALTVARPGVDPVAVADDLLYWAEHGAGKRRGVKLPAQTYRNFLKRVTPEDQRLSGRPGGTIAARERMMQALEAVARGDAQ